MTQSKLQSLISLLDDPSDDIAVSVMAEMLKYEAELMPLLGELQESENKLLRKRVQQLETIIMLRNRRRDFLKKINAEEIDIVEGLIELHLLYFDRDTPQMLLEMLQLFMQVADNNNIKNIAELGGFMARNNFALPPEDELLDPENYCRGPILEDRLGADRMLCTLALLAGIAAGLQLGLVRVAGRFAVINQIGEMISPENDWQVDRVNKLQTGDFWNDPKTVLKYASLMIFLYAVSSDNFRYVYTVAQALCGEEEEFSTDFLPYPYNGSTETVK